MLNKPLVFTIAMCVAFSGQALGADVDLTPARASDCISKTKGPFECLVEQVSYRFLLCKLTVEANSVGVVSNMAACSTSGPMGLTDFYAAALKKAGKSVATQSMTKDYYALWKSSMGALVPAGEISKMVWSAQAASLGADLAQKGERLQLEK